MIMVQKFGGSSVATIDKIKNIAKKLKEDYINGNEIVVVLSAMGNKTDELIHKAENISCKVFNKISKRELDMLLSIGEQESVALMTMALHELGLPAISLGAYGAGIKVSEEFGNARIQNIETEKIRRALEQKSIVVVTGFQGVTQYGDIATLGRGGSDTTAVALACALNAELCEIYTDVDGVYTADPRLVPNAKKLKEIDYDEMLELASLGAKVLHNRCVELSKKYNLPLIVRSSLEFDKEGTIIKGNTMEKTIISGLAVDKDVAQISVIGIKDNTGAAFKLFSLIAKKNIIVDVIVQTIGKGSRKDISFTVKEKDAKETIEILEKNRDFLDFEIINKKTGLLKLSVVGAGMASKPGVSASMFEALYDVGVNIHLISTSEIKISVLIDEEDEKIASNAVHDKLIKGI